MLNKMGDDIGDACGNPSDANLVDNSSPQRTWENRVSILDLVIWIIHLEKSHSVIYGRYTATTCFLGVESSAAAWVKLFTSCTAATCGQNPN